MTEKTILFSADITPESANGFVQILANLAAEKITKLTIGINSNGGGVVAGFFLYNALVTMPFDIVTHNVGNVDSIANVVFMAGDIRKSCAGSTFMFHGVGFESSVTERLEEKNLNEKLDIIVADHSRIAQVLSGKSNLSEEDCRSLLSQQSTRGADWALESGIVSEIASFAFPENREFYTFFG